MPSNIENDVSIEQIATTEDTNDPVFHAECPEGWMDFLFPSGLEHDIVVHVVESSQRGGMKKLLDAICSTYECENIRFSTPLSDQLGDRLHGFELVEEKIDEGPMEGETWRCLDGYWEVDDD